MTDYTEHIKKIRKARIDLMSSHPFFGDLAFGLQVAVDDTIDPPTAQVTPKKMTFHPEFLESLTGPETTFLVAHEVMHPALQHMFRRGKDRDWERWNVACDIVVNYLLHESQIGKMPACGVHDPDLYWQGNGKVEEIYKLLEKVDCGKPGSGNKPGGTPASMDAMCEGVPGEEDADEADWRGKIANAAEVAKKAGKLPGGLEQFVNQMLNPKVRWQDHLRNEIITTRGTDRTWAKRNRRTAATNLTLPGSEGEKMGEIVFAVDCSGSTSDEMVGQCGAEVTSIQEELRPEKTHIVYFDTEVKRLESYEADEPFTVKAYGRGGTCFRTIFERLAEEGIEPETCVVATDLECYDYGPDPGYPVIWVAMDSPYAKELAKNVPWGKVIYAD